jgi:hypothetical protein
MNVIVQNLAPFLFIPCVDIVALLACVVCFHHNPYEIGKVWLIQEEGVHGKEKGSNIRRWGHASLMKFNDVLVSNFFAFEGCCDDGK